MKKQFLKIALVGIMTSCFLMLVMGRVAKAQWGNWGWGNFNMPQYNYNWGDYEVDDDELTRGPHAWEVEENSGPGYTTYNYRQYTSAYDAMMGNMVAPMEISYSSTNPMGAMFNMFQPHETHSQGNAVGSLYPGTTMSFFSNPFSGMIAQMAPRYEGYSSQGIFGNTNMMMNYPGMGNSGFMWGPYSNISAGYGYGPGPYADRIY